MSYIHVSASRQINAPPDRVYAILADYHQAHPGILPKQFFRRLEVEEGGVGAGTRTKLEVHLMGTTRTMHHVVTEPAPGRVLVETDVDGSSITTFTVDPVGNGLQCTVTIDTAIKTQDGFLTLLARPLAALLLRRVYLQELALLAGYASGVYKIKR
ncbi:MAG TPA: SRPBCC family protein [Bacteroidota bacterium]|nr:SRPBCC family protein [Bacteroidota bacterium]